MSTQPPATAACEYAGILGDSEDSDEEPIPEGQLTVSWDDLPILERLGLTSGAEMTEEEVESAFTQLALAFRCDQYTLSQRLQAEEHDRSVAQENFRLEVEHSRDTLQYLRGRCADSQRSDILSQMEASLNTVLASMDDITRAAEMLGSVHQEARASCSVELMEIYVEHLKRRHTAESAELLETRKLFQRSRGRIHSDSGELIRPETKIHDDADLRHLFVRQASQQHLTRRRVSITLIPTQAQLSDLEAKFHDACKTNTDSQGPEEGAVIQEFTQESRQFEVSPVASPIHLSSDSAPLLTQSSTQSCQSLSSLSHFPPDSTPLRQNSTQSCQSQDEEGESVCHPSPLQMVQHPRRRSAILEGDTSSEEAKDQGSPPGSGDVTAEPSELSMADSVSSEPPLQMVLRHRRRSAILEGNASSEEAEDQGSLSGSGDVTAEPIELSMADSVTSRPLVVLSEQDPPASWLSYIGGVLLVLLLFLLFFLLLLGLLLWGLRCPRHHWTGATAI